MNKKEEEAEEYSNKREEEVVRWESNIQNMTLRVLLVEADDSTRHIIAALLRKCSYKVCAVSDGLKAWETLKGKPQNIDLILTEVDLPLISGYALLCLVMEHEICKSIPVIMMSAQDSISMVLKCMLKGAADYLIKPVRRNELRNLWRHVWRRQIHADRDIPQNMIFTQHKEEDSRENNGSSDHSSYNASSVQKAKGYSKKESDSQSSCTMPNLEAESAHIQNMQVISQPKCVSASNVSNTMIECLEGCAIESVIERSEIEGKSISLNSEVVTSNEERAHCKEIIEEKCIKPQDLEVNNNVMIKSTSCCAEHINPCSGAIGLIGKFDNGPVFNNGCSSINFDVKSNLEINPSLELCLRSSCSSSSLNNEGSSKRPVLNHSNASAFSWYKCSNSKTLRSTLQPLFPTHPSKVVGDTNKSYELFADQSAGNSSGVPHNNDVEMSNCLQDNASMVVDQPGIPEFSFPIPQVDLVSFTGPRFDGQCFQHGRDFPPFFYKTSISTPALSPKLACRAESCSPMNTATHTNPNIQGCHQSEEDATNMAVDRAKHEVLEPEEDTELDSPTTGQSESHISNNATGSVCGTNDGNALSTVVAVENATTGNALSTVVAVENATTSQSLNNRGQVVHEVCRGMDALRSKHREAALAKFRMKKKDRRFEKKVRYQNRKRLAEQRPRVKGQFVRQGQTYTPVTCVKGQFVRQGQTYTPVTCVDGL